MALGSATLEGSPPHHKHRTWMCKRLLEARTGFPAHSQYIHRQRPVLLLGPLYGTASHEHDSQSPTKTPCSESSMPGSIQIIRLHRYAESRQGTLFSPSQDQPRTRRLLVIAGRGIARADKMTLSQTYEADLFVRSREHHNYTSQSQEHRILHFR